MTDSDQPTNDSVAIKIRDYLQKYLDRQDLRINELAAQFQPSFSMLSAQVEQLRAQLEKITTDNSNTEALKVVLEAHEQRLNELHSLTQKNNFSEKIQELENNNCEKFSHLEQQLVEQIQTKMAEFQQALDEHLLEISKQDASKWVTLETNEDKMTFAFVENQTIKKTFEASEEDKSSMPAQETQQPQKKTTNKKSKTSIWQRLKNLFRKKKKTEEIIKDYLKTPSEFVEEQMIGLYRSLSALLPNRRHWGRSIQFISSRSGEGASVIAREFAKVLVRRLGMSVLLIDADPQGEQLAHFGIKRPIGWTEAVFGNMHIQYTLNQIVDSKLNVTQMAMPGESITKIIHAPEVEVILEDLKRQFDFIVIDSVAATASVDGLTLSHKVDGVIIVVEAECTRWQIVQQTKENIEIRGGNVLGVILNKRRFYIPKFIYDRLL